MDDQIALGVVIDIDIPANLHSASREVDIIELWSQHLVPIIEGTKRDGGTKDEEEEFVDNVEFESNEDSSQLSN